MPLHFGSANNDFSAQGFAPVGAIHSRTSTYSNSPSSARSFSGSVRVREGAFSENGGFNGFGRSGTIGDGAASNSRARSEPLGFGAGTFGHASGLGDYRLNDPNGGMLGGTGRLTRSGNGVEHGHSRFVSSVGSGIAGGGGENVRSGGNGAQSATSFEHSSNFEKYIEFNGVGNSGLGSGSLEQSKGRELRTGSNSLRSAADVSGTAENIRNNLDSTVHPSSNVNRGTRIGTGINGARNSLSLKSGSLVRTGNGELFGTEPSKEMVNLGGGAVSNVSSVFIVSEIRRNHFGRSTDYGGDSRLSDVSIPGAASSIEGGGKRLRVLGSVSGSQSGSLSGSGSNIGADDFDGSVGTKQGGSASGTESDVFVSGAGALGNSRLTRKTKSGGGGVGDTVTGSAGGDGKARLRLLEREEVLSSGHTGPALIINQSSSRTLKSNNVGLGSTNGIGTSDIDDGIKGLGARETFGRNKGFTSFSSAYTFKGGEMKRTFGSGHTGLTPGGSFSSFESPDNSGFAQPSSGSEKISRASSRKGLISEEVSEGPGSNSEEILGDSRNSENVNSLGSSTTTYTAISSSGSAVSGSTISRRNSSSGVSHFGSRSVSSENQNGTSISSRSEGGLHDVGGNSGSGIGLEGKSTGSEKGIGKQIVIRSRGSKSGSGDVTFGGSAATSEGASGPEDISASVHRPNFNYGDGFSGSEGAAESGLRGHAGSFRNVYVARGSYSLQSSFGGEGGSNVGSHYGSGVTTDGSSPESEGSASGSSVGIRGGSEPEGSLGLGESSVMMGSFSRLRDASSDFRSGDIDNNSRSGSNSGAVGGSVGSLGGSALPGFNRDSETVYAGGSYTDSSAKSGRGYGLFDGGRYRGDISGTESNSQSSESDSDVSEGSAVTLGGFRSTYEARGSSSSSSGDKSHGHAFESSTGNLRKNYRSGGNGGDGKSGSVNIFGDGSKIQSGFTNGGFEDTSSSSFGNNYANNGLSEISGSQNIYRRSYSASMTHSGTIKGSTGIASGLSSNSELGTGGIVLNNATEGNIGRVSGTHRGSNTDAFEGSIGRTSNMANYESGGIRDTRSEVTQSQIQRELGSDASASSAESLKRGSPCGSLKGGVGGYQQVGEGCDEGNIESLVKHQWNTANFGKERSTGENVNPENVIGAKAVEVHTIRNSELGGGLKGIKNSGRIGRLIIGTGTSGIVDENWKRESIVGDAYGPSASSSSGLVDRVNGGFSDIGGTDSGGFSTGGVRVEGGSTHGGDLSSSFGGSTLSREFSSNVHDSRSLGDYIRYMSGLRALGEAPALRATVESEHGTGTSMNVRGEHGSSRHSGLSSGRADGMFRHMNPFNAGGSMVQRVSSSSSFGESTSAGGGESGQPGEFPTNSGSKDRFAVAGFWHSGAIPDCGSGLDGTDVTSNSGIEP
jgi:hypothetical protein